MFLPQCILRKEPQMNTLLKSIQLSHALKSMRHKTGFHVALHMHWVDDQNSEDWPCITKLRFPHAQTGDSRYALHTLITQGNSRIKNSLFKLRKIYNTINNNKNICSYLLWFYSICFGLF